MELGFNNDTYYFSVKSDDILPGQTIDVSRDLISFSVSEELKRFRTGNVILRDNNHVYSRMLRYGGNLDVEWGYRTIRGLPFGSAPVPVRKGTKCIIQNPGGDGSKDGVNTYKMSFIATEILKPRESRLFDNGTIGDVVSQVFDNLGVTKKYIRFKKQIDAVTKEKSVRQNETSYSFLFNLSQKYRCFFQVVEDTAGVKMGIFTDYTNSTSAEVKAFLAGITVTSDKKELYYNTIGKSNVKSFSWNQNIGENGQGESVEIGIVNGETVFFRRVSQSQKVVFWRLSQEKIKKALAEKTTAGEKAKLISETLNAKDFEDVKKYFDPIESSTAPEGFGFVINCEIVGDPMVTPMMRVLFREGFPGILQQNQYPGSLCEFIVSAVTHTITKQGYTSSVEISDMYSINGSYLQEVQDIGSEFGL